MSAALFAYLSPVIAMLVGAGLGSALAGSDGATAVGAIAGFLGALVLARIAIGLAPAPDAGAANCSRFKSIAGSTTGVSP